MCGTSSSINVASMVPGTPPMNSLQFISTFRQGLMRCGVREGRRLPASTTCVTKRRTHFLLSCRPWRCHRQSQKVAAATGGEHLMTACIGALEVRGHMRDRSRFRRFRASKVGALAVPMSALTTICTSLKWPSASRSESSTCTLSSLIDRKTVDPSFAHVF